jgi:hypothetical protein
MTNTESISFRLWWTPAPSGSATADKQTTTGIEDRRGMTCSDHLTAIVPGIPVFIRSIRIRLNMSSIVEDELRGIGQ